MLDQPLPELNFSSPLYDQDFYLWTQQMVAALRNGQLDRLDLVNLAEEIEGVGKSEKRELRSRLRILLVHLLKWQFQPQKRNHSWQSTITEQRIQIQAILEDSPSFKALLAEMMAMAYQQARVKAADETQLAIATFPAACPYQLVDVLRSDFWMNLPGIPE